ncbi:exosome complex exonuclease RRP43 [Phialemonium atrogriseum]|uniref:Ribosomal RNA-processing protein 43 n=1 Tax=Phialemonium atrogriseum TaxID=1093897 RepID=A0AAJ0C4Q9_9PEZI|nr:exosome complex exonuclease RRP43 [Phialemonium atrogriseum]KAK1768667.1 exosome complex exonuclease RRP43 [Phialemonium atrogriseum]
MASSLTFPRATFAKLSPHPFLLANLNPTAADIPPTRTNGRLPHQARPPQVNTSSLSHAHGSAVVRAGDTTVICGVRGEILPVANIPQFRASDNNSSNSTPDTLGGAGAKSRELRDYDLLVPNVELATGCAPQFLPGAPPSAAAQTLATRVYELLHSCGVLAPEDLRIWYTPPTAKEDGEEEEEGGDARMAGGEDDEGRRRPEIVAYWTLYVDLLFVSFDGNAFDAAWAAVFLEKEHGPSAPGEGGKHWVLMDPDRLEEGLCQERITMVVDRSSGETKVRGISKAGGTVLGPGFMRDFAHQAERRWDEFQKAMR